ncbi:MAG: acyltransferase [Sphingobium sp.]
MHLAERPTYIQSPLPVREGDAPSRVREVDALRGIAALLVLIFHYTHRYPEMFPGAPDPGFGLNAGYDGVVLFFALSGFSIHFSFRRLAHVGDFVFARFARLFPAYWAAMAVTLAVQMVADVPQFRLPGIDMLVNVTMLQGFAHVGLVDGAYWTLAVELCFYACMAAIWRAGLLARLEWLLAGWLALAVVMHGWHGFPEPVAQFLVLRHIHFFAIGLIASRVHAGQRNWRQQMPIIAATVLTIWFIEGWQVLFVAGSALAFFAAMTAGRMRWICVPPLLWIGAISYPLYLVHQHVGMTIMEAAHGAGFGFWSGLAMATGVALCLGGTIHHLIERPAGDWLLRCWKRTGGQEHVPHMAESPVVAKHRLNELDALRGIGAILVMNFHYSTRFAEIFPRAHHVPFHLFSGNYRVMLFFAISGFAIFFTVRSLRSAPDFVVNRAARLFPAYWTAILLTLGVEYLGSTPQLRIPLGDVAINLTMLQAYFYVPPVDGAYWTLALELGFYACMLSLWMTGLVRRIEIVLIGWLFGKWVLFYWSGMPTRVSELLVLDWIPFFAIGLLSYRVWAGERRWRDQLPYIFILLLTVARTSTPDLILASVVILAVFAAMVEGRLQWLCLRPLLWIGSISYSLYLVHQHIGFVIMLNSDRFGLPPLMGYALACIAAVGLGAALHYGVERPASKVILRLWRNRRSRIQSPDRARAAA